MYEARGVPHAMPAHAEAAASAPPAKRLRANGHAADGEAAASPAAAQQALSAVEAAALRASGRQALRLGDEKVLVMHARGLPRRTAGAQRG